MNECRTERTRVIEMGGEDRIHHQDRQRIFRVVLQQKFVDDVHPECPVRRVLDIVVAHVPEPVPRRLKKVK